MAAMRPLPVLPVFSRAQARECGWSDSALSRAAGSGRLIRVRQNQFASVPPDRLLDAIAAARAHPASAVCARSAVLAHGLPLYGQPPERPELTVAPGGTGRIRGALVHRARLDADDIVLVAGVPVTNVARTIVDLARSAPLRTAVVAGDAALHRGLVTPKQLIRALAVSHGWPGIKRARRALQALDGRAESPLESISRLVIADHGLPAPELQAIVRTEDGWEIARLDFYWDEFGVVGESDGRSKYSERAILTDEKDRQEQLEDLGLAITRWGWSALHQPPLLNGRIRAAFERGRRRDQAGIARGWHIQLTPPLTLPTE
jgi:hypothetical protein